MRLEKPTRLLVRNGLLLNGSGNEPGTNASILIEGGRIKEVTRASIAVNPGWQVLDAAGKLVLPGFIDMHAHLISGGFDTISNVGITYDLERERRVLKQMLYWGVTSVYNPVQPLEHGLRLRQETVEGASPSPRLFISGPCFTAAGGWAGANDPAARIEPASLDDVRRAMDRLAEARVDIVKLFYEDMGCAFTQALPKLAAPLMQAIVQEAHRRGLKVMVHAYENRNHKEALRAGADLMAHSAVTAPVDDEYLSLARHNRMLYLATLSIYEDTFDKQSIRRLIQSDYVRATVPAKTLATLSGPGPLDEFERMIRQAYIRQQLPTIRQNLVRLWEAGVAIGVGPDTGVMGAFPGFAVHREMELMVQAGVPPAAVLQAATSNVAEYLGAPGDLGIIAPGARADLVVLNSNPLDEITNTRDIYAVVRDGIVIDRAKLLADVLEIQPPQTPVAPCAAA